MTAVTTTEQQARIDSALERATAAWNEVPELAKEWPTWNEDSRLDFEVDWPIQEDLLHQLKHWDASRRMTEAQQARCRRLLELVARSRPVVEALFGADPPEGPAGL